MAGMLGVGVALTLGIGLKVSAIAASALMVSMYLALWPIGTGGTGNAATNPLVDLHWVLALSTILFALTRAGDTLGLGTWWSRLVGDSWLRGCHQRRQTDERARAKYRVRQGACSTSRCCTPLAASLEAYRSLLRFSELAHRLGHGIGNPGVEGTGDDVHGADLVIGNHRGDTRGGGP